MKNSSPKEIFVIICVGKENIFFWNYEYHCGEEKGGGEKGKSSRANFSKF